MSEESYPAYNPALQAKYELVFFSLIGALILLLGVGLIVLKHPRSSLFWLLYGVSLTLLGGTIVAMIFQGTSAGGFLD